MMTSPAGPRYCPSAVVVLQRSPRPYGSQTPCPSPDSSTPNHASRVHRRGHRVLTAVTDAARARGGHARADAWRGSPVDRDQDQSRARSPRPSSMLVSAWSATRSRSATSAAPLRSSGTPMKLMIGPAWSKRPTSAFCGWRLAGPSGAVAGPTSRCPGRKFSPVSIRTVAVRLTAGGTHMRDMMLCDDDDGWAEADETAPGPPKCGPVMDSTGLPTGCFSGAGG
jgi:hypothetical protein